MTRKLISFGLLALGLSLAACGTEPEPEADNRSSFGEIEPVDRDAIGEDGASPSDPEASESGSDPQGETTMESGRNDGTEEAPKANSKLIPADPG